MAACSSAAEAANLARARVAEGARLAWIFGDRVDGRVNVHYVVSDSQEMSDFAGTAVNRIPSLTRVTRSAGRHEREVRDKFGVQFDGLPAETLSSPENPASHRRFHSSEVSTVLYGPIRSGIGESVCWVVETAGEDFLGVSPVMLFKNRGAEERFVGAPLEDGTIVAEHVCGATAVSHACAFSKAAESALRISVPPRAAATRAILIEFERIHQHLDSFAKLADDGSLSVGSSQTFAVKERVHRLLAEATGNRFARGILCTGGTRHDVMGALQSVCARDLNALEREAALVLEQIFGTQSLLDRLIGTGRVPGDVIRSYGAVGPVARGSGISCDARVTDDSLGFTAGGGERLEETGDAAGRAHVRRAEILQSFRLIREALDSAPSGAYCTPATLHDASGIARVESPQGELLYFVRFQGGIARVAVRSASYQNWPVFTRSLEGNIFTDFSFIEHSFGLLQAEVDR